MNFQETADLLAIVQAAEARPRQVDEIVIVTWQALLDDIDFESAREATLLRKRESSYPMEAADIRKNVERIRIAGLGPQRDEFDNDLPVDLPAVAAHQRLTSRTTRKAITS